MNNRAMLCLVPGAAAFMLVRTVHADTFGRVIYDRKNDQLIVTMLYRGTNPDHNFSLKWGQCRSTQSDDLPEVAAEVLDDQFSDAAQQRFRKTAVFSLEGLPCRPARVTLRTAPRFIYTLTIR
jgi:hypothetical protein